MSIRVKLPRDSALDPEMVIWTGGSRCLARIFHRRGIRSREEIEDILNPLARPEPDLSEYPPLLQARKRINAALERGEKIGIYGDYDVDGITATALLVTALEQLGADVIWHIPNRFTDGYGMNSRRIGEFAQKGVNLIITCDCGISNISEVDFANELGLDVIVTDHHTPPEDLPRAHTLVNFKLLPRDHPSRDLPGVGTAFILVRQLLAQHGVDAEDFLDLVALGIIADVVPLKGHNRQLYLLGLPVMKAQQRPGLAALFSIAKIQADLVDEEKLGFQIAPRLNAAGRLEDGAVAVKLLLAETKEQAAALARELDQLNSLRKELGRTIAEGINPEPGHPLVAYDPGWHQGVLGIVAGQICSGNGAPAILMTDSPDGGVVGSARSVEGVDIYAVLSQCRDYLAKFGGHPAAAGFSLDKDRLRDFSNALEQKLDAAMTTWTAPELQVDLVLTPQEIKLELVEELNRLAPCGEGNPRPIIFCRGLAIKSARSAGSGHILTLGDRWRSFSAGLWNGGPAPEAGGSIDAVFTVSEDVYRGQRSVLATLQAWWPGHEKPVESQLHQFEDLRKMPWQRVIKKYPEASIYREGVEWQDYPGNTRNNLAPDDTLVLMTAPPSAGILRQILGMAEPALVVLAYPPERGSFLPQFMGAVKYILNEEAGVASLPGLAAALGYTEETVLAGFRVLDASRIVGYQVEEGRLILHRLAGTKVIAGPWTEKLRVLVEETAAFRRWMQNAKISEIQKIKA